MRLAIIEYGCNFEETYQRLSTGQEATYHAHPYIFDLMLNLSQQVEEVVYICCCAKPCRSLQLQPGLRSLNAALDPYKEFDQLVELLEAQNLTHLVIYFPHRQLFQWAIRKNIKTIGILADSFETSGWRNRIKNFLLARTLNHRKIEWVGNHGINSSRSLAGIGVDPKKIVPWDWVYTKTPSQFSPRSKPSAKACQLLYVGSVWDFKGVGDVIHAIAELKMRQTFVHLKIAGRGEIDYFRDLAQQLQVEDQIEFLGLVPHQAIYSLMRDATAVVVPSHHSYPEGFPLTIYEALCTRTPVIASDHPMFAGVLRDRETALIFPEQNATRLADCVQQLIYEPQLYERLSLASETAWHQLQIPVKWGDLLQRWLSHSESDRHWLAERALASGRYETAIANPQSASDPYVSMR